MYGSAVAMISRTGVAVGATVGSGVAVGVGAGVDVATGVALARGAATLELQAIAATSVSARSA